MNDCCSVVIGSRIDSSRSPYIQPLFRSGRVSFKLINYPGDKARRYWVADCEPKSRALINGVLLAADVAVHGRILVQQPSPW